MTDRVTTAILVLAITLGGILVAIDLLTLKRLWASPLFETSQKIAQTILIWLVPGSVFVVRHLLLERSGARSDDPTAANQDHFADSTFMDHGGHHNV